MKIKAIEFLTKTTEITPQSSNRISRAGNPTANDRAAKTQTRFDWSRKIFLWDFIKFLYLENFFKVEKY